MDTEAPEVINYDCLDCSADIWSFGVLVYYLLVGESPFHVGEQPIKPSTQKCNNNSDEQNNNTDKGDDNDEVTLEDSLKEWETFEQDMKQHQSKVLEAVTLGQQYVTLSTLMSGKTSQGIVAPAGISRVPAISTFAKNIIKICIQRQPRKRPTASEILGHRWFSVSAAIIQMQTASGTDQFSPKITKPQPPTRNSRRDNNNHPPPQRRTPSILARAHRKISFKFKKGQANDSRNKEDMQEINEQKKPIKSQENSPSTSSGLNSSPQKRRGSHGEAARKMFDRVKRKCSFNKPQIPTKATISTDQSPKQNNSQRDKPSTSSPDSLNKTSEGTRSKSFFRKYYLRGSTKVETQKRRLTEAMIKTEPPVNEKIIYKKKLNTVEQISFPDRSNLHPLPTRSSQRTSQKSVSTSKTRPTNEASQSLQPNVILKPVIPKTSGDFNSILAAKSVQEATVSKESNPSSANSNPASNNNPKIKPKPVVETPQSFVGWLSSKFRYS